MVSSIFLFLFFRIKIYASCGLKAQKSNSSGRTIRQTHPRRFNTVLELFSLKSLCSTQTAGALPQFWNFFSWKAEIQPNSAAVTLSFGTFFPEKASVRPKSQMLYPSFGTFSPEKPRFSPTQRQSPWVLELFPLKSLCSTQTVRC